MAEDRDHRRIMDAARRDEGELRLAREPVAFSWSRGAL
jgi:hypothetical protein